MVSSISTAAGERETGQGVSIGNLVTLAVLFFWIYYEALGFILGGEVAQVWTMRRARRVQIRDVHGGAR